MTREEVIELEAKAIAAQQGDALAEEELIRFFRPICLYEAKRYFMPDADMYPLYSEAMEWSWRAIHIWRPERGCRLIAWVKWVVRRKITAVVRTATREMRYDRRGPPIALDAPTFRDGGKSVLESGIISSTISPSAEEEFMRQVDAEITPAAKRLLDEMSKLELVCLAAKLLRPSKHGARSLGAARLLTHRGIDIKSTDNAWMRVKRKTRAWAEEEVASGNPSDLARMILTVPPADPAKYKGYRNNKSGRRKEVTT